MSYVKIMTCTCKSKYQDKKYGKGNRVFNEGEKVYRCSVCGREVFK